MPDGWSRATCARSKKSSARRSSAARGSGLAPTRIGERLHHVALPLVAGLERLPELFEEQHTGVAGEALRIGAGEVSGGSVLPALVRRFQARWPRTRVEVRSGTGAERLMWLRGFELDLPAYLKRFRDAHPDIAVRLDAATVPEGFKRLADDEVDFVVGPRERFDEERIVYRELRTYRIVLITAPDHPLAGRTSVSPREAAAHPAVVPPEGTYSRQFGEDAAEALGIVINAVVEVGGWGVLKRYVEAGFGTLRRAEPRAERDRPARGRRARVGRVAAELRRVRALRPALDPRRPALPRGADSERVRPTPPPPADSGTAPPGMRPRARCVRAAREQRWVMHIPYAPCAADPWPR